LQSRCFVISLGFHEDVALRRIAESSARSDDRIVIVTGPPVPASQKTVDSLKLYASRLGLAEPVVLHLDPESPSSSIVRLAEVLARECSGRRLVLEIGGGLRANVALVLLAAAALKMEFSIESTIEGSSAALRVPWGFLEYALYGLETRDAQLLSTLAKGGFESSGELARALGVGEKTVVNRISHLRRLGLVAKRGRGRPELTEWGLAVARLHDTLRAMRRERGGAEEGPTP